ncbi:tryptophan synthase subunit alpha [Corynebacterium caspium]|uniref:tryptophan synthase subunit alpha n=1 Tax=Corynebacterium caspium TaxID=234828 RepID=UPI000378FE03|nr:tryptophan synthase subunit alpha [Corynebacterium caspium]WKD60047.1 Tryptophan synthase alpha chain [Corynebacterium caspium DSM 44850]
MSRYSNTFKRLATLQEGAFVPFLMLNDPSPQESLEIIRTVISAGADALELGIPFSDPVADGPTVARSHIRALAGGATLAQALELIAAIRAEFPDIPIGLLLYGNMPYSRGLERFYTEVKEAGADSVLIPDVPVREGEPFIAAAKAVGIDPIFIAPARANAETLAGVSKYSRGYIYAISRDGVTGTEREAETTGLTEVVNNVSKFGGAPVLLGFGISTPEHVAKAISAGASGAITGSALMAIIEKHLVADNSRVSLNEHDIPAMKVADMDALKVEITNYISAMKAATRS